MWNRSDLLSSFVSMAIAFVNSDQVDVNQDCSDENYRVRAAVKVVDQASLPEDFLQSGTPSETLEFDVIIFWSNNENTFANLVWKMCAKNKLQNIRCGALKIKLVSVLFYFIF